VRPGFVCASSPEPAGRRSSASGAGALVVRLTAPPVEGRANEALCKLIAKHVGVAKGRVTVVRGAGTRDKVVRVEGIGAAELRRALCGPR
jgi:uncharacterized protein